MLAGFRWAVRCACERDALTVETRERADDENDGDDDAHRLDACSSRIATRRRHCAQTLARLCCARSLTLNVQQRRRPGRRGHESELVFKCSTVGVVVPHRRRAGCALECRVRHRANRAAFGISRWTRRVREIARVWEEGTPIEYAIAVSATERHVILVDSGGHVQRWDARSRRLLGEWTITGATNAVELDDGSVVVLSGSGTLQRLAPNSTTPEPIAFNLGGLGAVAVAGSNALYLSNFASGSLHFVDLQDGSSRTITTGLQVPQSLAVLPDGGIVGVTTGAQGTIYVTSAAENSIYQLQPIGTGRERQ
jgi:hypothetical protein